MTNPDAASSGVIVCMLGLLFLCSCSAFHPRAKLQVNLDGQLDDVAVELLRLENSGKETYVQWKLPENQRVQFGDLPPGRYRVLLEPEAQGLARQCIGSRDVFLENGASRVLAMTAPEGRIRVHARFISMSRPSWWTPTNVVPVRVTKTIEGDSEGSPFRLYLWLRESERDVWCGDLSFVDEGDYAFTLFEHDMENDVVKDLATVNVSISQDALDAGSVNVSF